MIPTRNRYNANHGLLAVAAVAAVAAVVLGLLFIAFVVRPSSGTSGGLPAVCEAAHVSDDPNETRGLHTVFVDAAIADPVAAGVAARQFPLEDTPATLVDRVNRLVQAFEERADPADPVPIPPDLRALAVEVDAELDAICAEAGL